MFMVGGSGRCYVMVNAQGIMVRSYGVMVAVMVLW